MKKLQALFCALLVCTLLLSGLPRTASAAYPDRPVTIITRSAPAEPWISQPASWPSIFKTSTKSR